MSITIERVAVGALVFAVSLLTIVGLMAIWQWVDSDVLYKSMSTIGVVALAALVVVGIARVARHYGGVAVPAATPPSAAWVGARNMLLGIVGAVFLIFAGLSIASIWDFVGSDTLTKSLSSMGLLFISAVIMLVAFRSQQDA